MPADPPVPTNPQPEMTWLKFGRLAHFHPAVLLLIDNEEFLLNIGGRREYSKIGYMSKEHRYQVVTKWTGNLGSGTSHYKAYSRDHEISGPQKQAPIPGPSSPLFPGAPPRYKPEDLLVAALSAVLLLWLLHLFPAPGTVHPPHPCDPYVF